MKNIKTLCLLAVMGMLPFMARGTVLLENPLTIGALDVTPGERAELEIHYSSDEAYIGLEFELLLPAGVTFASDPANESEVEVGATNSSLTSTHFLSAKVHDDGVYKAVFVSMRNDVIKSGSRLLRIPLEVSPEFSGSAEGAIRECRFAAATQENQYLSPAYFEVFVAPTELRIMPDVLSMEPEQTISLAVAYEPEGAARRQLVWRSSDEEVATVDDEGNVSAIATGEALISASLAEDSGITAVCKVTVSVETGVEEIVAASLQVDVFDIRGLMLLRDAAGADLQRLARGVYIVRSGEKIYKVRAGE